MHLFQKKMETKIMNYLIKAAASKPDFKSDQTFNAW